MLYTVCAVFSRYCLIAPVWYWTGRNGPGPGAIPGRAGPGPKKPARFQLCACACEIPQLAALHLFPSKTRTWEMNHYSTEIQKGRSKAYLVIFSLTRKQRFKRTSFNPGLFSIENRGARKLIGSKLLCWGSQVARIHALSYCLVSYFVGYRIVLYMHTSYCQSNYHAFLSEWKIIHFLSILFPKFLSLTARAKKQVHVYLHTRACRTLAGSLRVGLWLINL